ncbi:hypothetical protein [Microcoleus vaginatus]|uniref:hypothetical protein n=1 Tax=Microcoleus vaginatus TaxID=119532 RepID=UPI0032A7BD42
MSINDYDWQKIDTFDEKVEWQKSLAREVYSICIPFTVHFGEKHEKETDELDLTTYNYQDDIVQISYKYKLYDDGRELSSTEINLVPLHTRVFSVIYVWGQNRYIIDCFRVGSWLNHMESLRLRLEPIKKAEEEKRKQEEARRFGRLE